MFIAQHSKEHELEALRMAVDEVKKSTMNTSLYQELIQKIDGRLGAMYQLDTKWVADTDKKAHQQHEKLESELAGYKTNLIKESIRMGHTDLGDHFYERGDLNTALKCYVRTRDYCVSSKHIISMCLNVIKVSIEMGNFTHVANYVSKAENTPDVQDPVVLAKLKCCAGLSNLESGKYKIAARKFEETSFELGSSYSEVIAPHDIGMYGSLCALASCDRSELKTKVIDNIQFKNFLELVPDVRELINDFYSSRYASCLNTLNKLKPDLLLDIHLRSHVDTLYDQIRSKALVQYFSPFVSVDLSTMAEAFNTTVTNLEHEVAHLIMENQIQARIDSHNKILYARHADQRAATFQKALSTGQDYIRSTKALLLRVNLLKHNFTVKPPQSAA
mmetsp:Transcript_37463/g.60668  ORF Transcript_37463/g.60668 Transcript_37463/m.60668 type:complete len:389 (-) Transcript_37463:225-1391(-)